MKIEPIRSKADYKAALAKASQLIDKNPTSSSVEGKFLEVLSILIVSYEDAHFPIDNPDAISAIRFRMEQSDLNPKDLVPSIGSINRVYEILNGKRTLSLAMIRNLNKNLGIPLSALVK